MLAQQGMGPGAILEQEGGPEFYQNQIALPAAQQLELVAALESLMAQEGLTQDQTTVTDLLKQQEEAVGGPKTMETFLNGMRMTEDQFTRLLLAPEVMMYQLQRHFAGKDPEAVRQNFEEKYLRCKHVLVMEDEGTSEKEALANEIAQKARNGADFDELIAQYNEDPGMAANPDGYVFPEGQMVQEFYEGTKALEMNAISDPVRTNYGWHIIQRLPIDDDIYAANREQAENDYFFTIADAWLAEAEIVASDEAKAVTYLSVREEAEPAPEAAPEAEASPEAETAE